MIGSVLGTASAVTSGTLPSNQAQIRDSKWFSQQRGQKIAVFVLGKLLKLDLSTSTPMETWCPVVGHTKTKCPWWPPELVRRYITLK
jgi:hypothetical protein